MNKNEKGNLIRLLLHEKTFDGCFLDLNKYHIPDFFRDDIFHGNFGNLSHNFLDKTIKELKNL